jgi:hypothetical protein
MSYPPGQGPPTWGGQQQPPSWGGQQQPPTWGGPPPPGQPPGPPPTGWGPPAYYSVTPSRSGANPLVIIGLFVGILVLVAAVVGAIVLMNQPAPPKPPCVPGIPCAPGPSLPPIALATPTPKGGVTPAPGSTPLPPPSSSAPATGQPGPSAAPATPPSSGFQPQPTPVSDSPAVVLGGSVWRSSTLGYGFEYDPELWDLSQSTDELALLDSLQFNGQLLVEATTAETTPDEMIDQELAVIDGFMIGRTKDKDDYDAVLDPSVGYVRGTSAVFSGILLGNDGTPVAPGGVTIMASTNGRITVVVVVVVAQPDERLGADTYQHLLRTAADDIVKTVDWGAST